MRIPAADIDETEIVLFAHQPADSARRQFEALGRDRATVGRSHFLGCGFIHVIANLESLGHRAGQRILCIHARDQFGLAIIDPWFGDRTIAILGILTLPRNTSGNCSVKAIGLVRVSTVASRAMKPEL